MTVCSNIQDFQGPLVISIDCVDGKRCQTKDKDSLLHWDCGCLRTKVQEIVGSTLIFSALNNMKQTKEFKGAFKMKPHVYIPWREILHSVKSPLSLKVLNTSADLSPIMPNLSHISSVKTWRCRCRSICKSKRKPPKGMEYLKGQAPHEPWT